MTGAGAYPMVLRVALVREGECGPELSSPGEVGRFLHDWANRAGLDDGREHFGFVALDTRHRMIGLLIVSSGALTATLVHPREVFAPALVAKACALVLWHTHPSLDVEPSADDVALTRRLAAGGSLLGIEVLDSLVIAPAAPPAGRPRWCSLKDRGIV